MVHQVDRHIAHPDKMQEKNAVIKDASLPPRQNLRPEELKESELAEQLLKLPKAERAQRVSDYLGDSTTPEKRFAALDVLPSLTLSDFKGVSGDPLGKILGQLLDPNPLASFNSRATREQVFELSDTRATHIVNFALQSLKSNPDMSSATGEYLFNVTSRGGIDGSPYRGRQALQRALENGNSREGLDILIGHLAKEKTIDGSPGGFQDYALALRKAQKLFPSSIGRFSPDVLIHLVQTEERGRGPSSQPVAFIMYTTEDNSRAFVQTEAVAANLVERGYRVAYREYSSDKEFSKAARDLEKKFGPADGISVGGHGRPTGIQAGPFRKGAHRDTAFVDLFDETDLTRANISKSLKTGGFIILESCETGSGLNRVNNVANMFGRLFPQASEISAPTASTSVKKLEWEGRQSKTPNVIYFDPVTESAGGSSYVPPKTTLPSDPLTYVIRRPPQPSR